MNFSPSSISSSSSMIRLRFLRAAHVEVELQRAADDRADGLTRVHRHVGHLIDHLQLAQVLAGAARQIGGQLAPGKGDLTIARRQQTGDHPRQRGLARAGFAHNRQRLPRMKLDIDVVQHVEVQPLVARGDAIDIVSTGSGVGCFSSCSIDRTETSALVYSSLAGC